jgi:7,8-dihydropterin-6-yl-methyl-4-(beta-D-ribofuranosyl)aminobenzene 5'-phosphate synthase
MKVYVVSENTAVADSHFKERFGLGLCVVTDDKTILIDCGPDESFLYNMDLLGLDVTSVDYIIITHAHYDHGGGLRAFLQENKTAGIYLSQGCGLAYYSDNLQTSLYKYIGLDSDILQHNRDRLTVIKGNCRIDEHVSLFHITRYPGFFFPKMNNNLYVRKNGTYVKDDFLHEMTVLIEEDRQNHIFTGCAHSGVTNMVRTVEDETGISDISTVIGGFHLVNPGTKTIGEESRTVEKLAEELESYHIGKILTGHCTGDDGFQLLKSRYHGNIDRMTTGMVIDL